MPNWCYTTITINNLNKDQLNKFDKMIDDWTDTNFTNNDFGKNWLGNIVGNSNIGTIDTGRSTDLRCRGVITSKSISDTSLIITTETAWEPMLKMWTKIIEKFFPNAELIYTAEEPGNRLYMTNDPVLVDKYIVRNYSDDISIDENDELSEEECISLLQDLLDIKNTNIEELLLQLDSSIYNDNIIINKWEFNDNILV